MPVVGRDDEDGVDVGAGEQILVFVVDVFLGESDEFAWRVVCARCRYR